MELSQTTLLYRVRKTMLQMMKDRGYLISEKKLNQTKAEFEATFNGKRESLNMLLNKRGAEANDASQKILVFFPDQEKLNKEGIELIQISMIENKVYNSVVVIKGTTSISRRVSILLLT